MSDGIDPDVLDRAHCELLGDGHTVVRNVVSPETAARWRALVQSATDRMDALEMPPGNEVYQRAFEQYMNLWEFDAACAEIAMSSHLGSIAASLLGVDGVRLYHDQALIKKGGGGFTPWHQDQWYWPLDTDRTVTMWLALHDFEPDAGELEFALGTHRSPITASDDAAPISATGEEFYEGWLADHDVPRRRTGSMRAGDASFHLGWTLHRAEPNRTPHDREVMTVIWFADGARLLAPASASQEADRERWLPDTEVGEVASSRLNPLVGGRN